MEVKIKYLGGQKFSALCRQHEIIIDQPKEKGGTDQGMNPLEVLLVALGSCTGVYAKTYCQSSGVETKDLEISVSSSLTKEAPFRFKDISVKINLGQDIAERKGALRNFINNCPVGSTLRNSPNIDFVI